MMSCTQGTGRDQFMEEVAKLSADIMGKKYYQLTYNQADHAKISRWLLNAANITQLDDLTYNAENSKITVSVLMDEILYQKYRKEFETEQF